MRASRIPCKAPDHLHDDPSRGSDQPTGRLKSEAGTPVPLQYGSRLGTAAAAAAAAAAAHSAPLSVPASSLDHHPAVDYFHGGRKCVQALLSKVDPEFELLLAMGAACENTINTMIEEQWLRISGDPSVQKDNKKLHHKYSFTVIFNYGGSPMQQQQWDQREEGCPILCPSSKAADAETQPVFEAGLGTPAVLVDCAFRTETNPLRVYVRGAGLDVQVDGAAGSTKQHMARVSHALCQVTVVLLLLWHAQDKEQHPELQRVAQLYRLQPVKKVEQAQPQPCVAQQTSTAAAKQHLLEQIAVAAVAGNSDEKH